MANLAALRGSHAPGLAGRVRRHVVVHHEALAVLAGERVDDLLIAPGAERDGDERLGLAAGEERRTVRARQHTDAHGHWTHGARVAAVDARLAVEDLAAHDLRLEVEEQLLDDIGVERLAGHGSVRDEALEDRFPDLAKARIARLLLLDA